MTDTQQPQSHSLSNLTTPDSNLSPSPQAILSGTTTQPENASAMATTMTEPTTTTTQTQEIEAKIPPTTFGSIAITLLLLSGARTSFNVDGEYLRRHNKTESDPLSMTVYQLKECIWEDWKEEFDKRPVNAHLIRLISFGKLMEDKSPLRDYRLHAENPNVIHMTIRPSESNDDDAQSGKPARGSGHGNGSGPGSGAREGRSSAGCRCVIV